MPNEEIISSRSDLLSLLSEACELEHGLACSYLYAAFTLKRDLHEGGLTWQQLQRVRKWAAQIYFVASQEMLHLAQAWNLLTAIGGTPYYLRPNFPQGTKYYPAHLPLALEPFGHESLKRFIFYERPVIVSTERSFSKHLGVTVDDPSSFPFRTVGELYRLIASGVQNIPEKQLFIGAPTGQVGSELIDFPDIVKVSDRNSAAQAISMVTHQGEGTAVDRTDCHFGVFHNILAELEEEEGKSTTKGETFIPARDSIRNPAAQRRGDSGAVGSQLIEDPYARQVAELFDSIYGLMLRMLAYVFSNSSEDVALSRTFSTIAIIVMPTVILPLGEGLTVLPAGPHYGHKTAGPGFGMSRHVPLPANPQVASILVRERLAELLEQLEHLAAHQDPPARIISARDRLVDLSSRFTVELATV